MHCGTTVSSRADTLAALAIGHFDVVVVGGGINGAGIARDAALRGLSVAVLEQGDFASGTSSRSSKLIHGGLRYLEHGQIKLVLEATRERERLRRLAPHLVRPMRFVVPVYAGARIGRWKLRAALWAYDLLAGLRNVQRHRMLSAAAVRAAEPWLRAEGLRGAGEYWDCWTNDARLVVETMRSAAAAGAVVLSYTQVVGFAKDGGRIVGVRARDGEGGGEVMVRGRVVVNATGPWVDDVCAFDAPAPPRLRLTKGVHVVVPRVRVGNDAAWVLSAVRDDRVMFVIPWGEYSLVGTTDTDHHGGPAVAPVVEPDDVAYLLETVNHYAPAARLEPGDVVGAYAGLRPLIAPDRDDASPSAVSREEAVFESPSGLLSIAGGKLTTYRLIAAAVVDRVAAVLARDGRTGIGGSTTADTPLAAPVLEPSSDRRAHFVAAVEHEWARTVEDVLVRRTQLGVVDAAASVGVAEEVAAVMAERLGWTPATARAAADAYVRTVEAARRRWV